MSEPHESPEIIEFGHMSYGFVRDPDGLYWLGVAIDTPIAAILDGVRLPLTEAEGIVCVAHRPTMRALIKRAREEPDWARARQRSLEAAREAKLPWAPVPIVPLSRLAESVPIAGKQRCPLDPSTGGIWVKPGRGKRTRFRWISGATTEAELERWMPRSARRVEIAGARSYLFRGLLGDGTPAAITLHLGDRTVRAVEAVLEPPAALEEMLARWFGSARSRYEFRWGAIAPFDHRPDDYRDPEERGIFVEYGPSRP